MRIANTVRRPAGPHTSAVHALLSHLHTAGFQGCGMSPTPCTASSRCPPTQGGSAATRPPGRVFAGAYGLDESQRRELVPMLAGRARSMRDFLARQATAGVQPWLGLQETGHRTAWQADADYIGARTSVWSAALLGE